MPPAPPGEDKKSKKGFLSKIFSGKEKENLKETAAAPLPETPPAPGLMAAPPLKDDEPEKASAATGSDDLDLDKIRKQLGLDNAEPTPKSPSYLPEEPSKNELKAKPRPSIDDLKPRYSPKDTLSLPKLEDSVSKYDPSDFAKDPRDQAPGVEIPKSPIEEAIPDYKSVDYPFDLKKDYKSIEKPRPVKDVKWTEDIEPEEINKSSQFTKDIISKPEEAKKGEKSEFLEDVGEEAKEARKDEKKAEPKKLDKKQEKDIDVPMPPETDKARGGFDFTQEPEPVTPGAKEIELPDIEPLPGESPLKKEEKRAAEIKPEAKPEDKRTVPEEKPARKHGKHDHQKAENKEQPEEKLEEVKPERIEDQPEQRRAISERILKFTEKVRANIRREVKTEEKKKLLKQIEEERKALQDEKEAFEKEKIRVAGLDNKLKFKEKQISKEREGIEKEKQSLKAEREQLEADRKDAKSLKAKLPHLRREDERLTKHIMDMKERLELNEKIEKNLGQREAALKEAQESLEKMEAAIRERGFSEFLDNTISGRQVVYPSFSGKEDEQTKPHSEIYEIVDECRGLIWEHKLEEAKRAYMKARDIYNKLEGKVPESEEIYNLIRELYDDINLALIKG